MRKITIMGAGGKMGYRLSANLRNKGYEMRHVEVSEAGRARLAELEIACMPQKAALDGTEVVIMAVPDTVIGTVSHAISPLLPSGVMLIILDAAAPFAGHLPQREDLHYFVAHPCHPPVFNDEVTAEAKQDYFGGLAAKQHIVCSLMQGPDSSYAIGEGIARDM